jgi:hypothetical protein
MGCGNKQQEKLPPPEPLATDDDDRRHESRTPMPHTSKFTFDGRQYQITNAEILAAIGDPYWCDTFNKGKGKTISWGIRFQTETDEEDDDDGDMPHPNVDFDGLQIRVKNWYDLAGYEAAWDKPINPETDQRYGMTYVFDHQLISTGRLQIASRKGTEFRIVASGQNEEGQQFSIDAPAVFKGIYVRGSERDSDDTIRARLKQHMDDTNLVGTPFKLDVKYDSGVMAGQSFFSPTDQ